MNEREVLIKTADGEMETFVTHPEDGGPFPAVVFFMDVWGMREEFRDIARRVATVGYYCLVPDLFYRHGRVRFDYWDKNGKRMSLARLDDDIREMILAPARSTTDTMVMEDTNALIRFIDADELVQPGGMGSIGYCWGGRLVLRTAAWFPDRFRAGASLHGTDLVTDKENSPHLSAKAIRGELYCGFGERDPYAPPSTIQVLKDVLSSAPVNYRYLVHPGAEHGYALPDRDIYNKKAANRDWERIFVMFQRQIPHNIGTSEL